MQSGYRSDDRHDAIVNCLTRATGSGVDATAAPPSEYNGKRLITLSYRAAAAVERTPHRPVDGSTLRLRLLLHDSVTLLTIFVPVTVTVLTSQSFPIQISCYSLNPQLSSVLYKSPYHRFMSFRLQRSALSFSPLG